MTFTFRLSRDDGEDEDTHGEQVDTLTERNDFLYFVFEAKGDTDNLFTPEVIKFLKVLNTLFIYF